MSKWDKMNPDMGNSDDNGDDIPPVKFSKWNVGLILVGLMIVCIIMILTVRSCRIERSVSTSSVSASQEIALSEPNLEVTDPREASGEFQETEAVLGSSISSSVESSTSAVLETSLSTEVSGTVEGHTRLVEVSEPVLGDVYSTTAMVSSKNIYLLDSKSYAYSINLVLLVGEDNTTTVEYFCPRSTYDALVSADTVVAEYQIDSNGAISIVSISR